MVKDEAVCASDVKVQEYYTKNRKDILDGNESLFGSKLLNQSHIEIRRFSGKLKILTAAKVRRKYDVPFPKFSNINQIDPFLNSNSVICVGGRLKRSFFNEELKGI